MLIFFSPPQKKKKKKRYIEIKTYQKDFQISKIIERISHLMIHLRLQSYTVIPILLHFIIIF